MRYVVRYDRRDHEEEIYAHHSIAVCRFRFDTISTVRSNDRH